MILIREIVIEPLLHHVQLSKKTKEKWSTRLNKVTGKEESYQVNPDSAGLPKYMKISGNDVYANGQGGNFTISKMLNAMKDSVMEVLMKEEPITIFPICIEIEIHTTRDQIDYKYRNGVLQTPKSKRDKAAWDIGNFWVWSKIFDDCLIPYKEPVLRTGKKENKDKTKYRGWKGLIPDDSIDYIKKTGGIEYFEINDYSKRKIIFKIYNYEHD